MAKVLACLHMRDKRMNLVKKKESELEIMLVKFEEHKFVAML
jgi:hypothetical protein